MRWASYLLCLAGIFTTWMLSVSYHYRLQLPCGGSDGCTAVAMSPLARIAGIPTPLLGLGFYLILAFVTLRSMMKPSTPSPYWFAILGAAISTGFTIHAAAALRTTCAWCLASNIIACLLAIALGIDRGEKPATSGKVKVALVVGTAVAFVAMELGAQAFVNHARKFPWNPEALAKTTLAELVPTDSILLNGTQTGPVIVMFVDLQCPACKASFQSAYGAALKNHIRLAIRHFPHNKLHPEAYALAVQAEEAAQQEQGINFLADAFKQNVDDQIKGRALLHSLNMREAPQLVQQAKTRIARDRALAKQLGLTETPSIFIVKPNHKPEAVGSASVEEALRAK